MSNSTPKGRRRAISLFGLLAGTIIALFFVLTSLPSMADPPNSAKGKAISGLCAACHGSEGRATNSSYPNLAGQNYNYLVNQLEKFKKGQRDNAIMHGIAAGLSTVQIKDLAAYYATLGPRSCPSHKSPMHNG